MAALVCDICGGKPIMGGGGIAVCDSCGMEYSPDRMKEKNREIKETVFAWFYHGSKTLNNHK